jgi:uncharacterized membrane protein
MKLGEILETIVIIVALIALLPIAYWWHMGELQMHRQYFYFLFILLCLLGYVMYRRIKRLRAVLKSTKKGGGPGPKVPPFYR